MKLFINDSDGKEDENNVNVTSSILTSHIRQHNKINKIDDSDSQTMALRLMTAKILISIKFLCSKRDSSYCLPLDSDIVENIVDLIKKEGGGI